MVAGSVHSEILRDLQTSLPELSWREIHAADSLEVMQLVSEEKAELAIVDSIEFDIQQRLFPRLVAALELGKATPVVWYLPKREDNEVALGMVNRFLEVAAQSGDIAHLKRLHFGQFEHASRLGSLTFQRKMRSQLPQWQSLMEQVAREYLMDWRLLAAMAYQESHWNPDATIPYGGQRYDDADSGDRGESSAWMIARMPEKACAVALGFLRICSDGCPRILKSPIAPRWRWQPTPSAWATLRTPEY